MVTFYISAGLANGISQIVIANCQFEFTRIDDVTFKVNSYGIDRSMYVSSFYGRFPYQSKHDDKKVIFIIFSTYIFVHF